MPIPATDAQLRALYDALLQTHAALHAIDEGVSFAFAEHFGLCDRDTAETSIARGALEALATIVDAD